MLHDLHLFFSEFRRNFTSTGALAPSSPALANAMLKPLRRRPVRNIKVLEVGPGTGAFTFQILRHLRPGDTLCIFELNDRFYQYLKERLEKNAGRRPGVRVDLYHRDIRALDHDTRYDYIISGLPFANFEAETVSEIMGLYLDHLAPGGVISYFEYILPRRLRLLLIKPHKRERVHRMLAWLKTCVQRHQTQCSHVWFNFPPARVRHLQRQNTIM